MLALLTWGIGDGEEVLQPLHLPRVTNLVLLNPVFGKHSLNTPALLGVCRWGL